jgi:GTP cyclohydrolase I
MFCQFCDLNFVTIIYVGDKVICAYLTKRRFCGLDKVNMTCDHEKLKWMVQRNLIELDAKCEIIISQLKAKVPQKENALCMLTETIHLNIMTTIYNHHFDLYSKNNKHMT